MASGKTLDLQALGRTLRWRKTEPRETVARDRSLRGKDRIRARKAKQRAERAS